MQRFGPAMYLALGAIVADLILLSAFLWLHYEFTVGVAPGSGVLALIVVGVVGAALGFAVFKVRRAT